ncbi:MAG: DUF4159 domain-containing protein [Deltaproteobacteria bacterium]|nr:DUF4159 domain-containing protein [Deltaproteobacteria bacterium]
MTSRRALLAGLVAGLALPRISLAFGRASKVDIAELDIPGTLSRPNAWTRMLYEVVHTTSVECEPRSVRIAPDDPELFEHPFAALVGREALDGPTTEGLGQLARYLAYGGFLFIDETTGAESSAFDEAVRDLCGILFPTRPLSPLPTDHSVYRSFFLLDRPVGRVARFPYLEGITVGNVCPVIYCRNDLSGALERGDDGRHRYPVVPGGEWQRREAVKLGINLILYALTANYKKDQAHVRQLMLDGRLE